MIKLIGQILWAKFKVDWFCIKKFWTTGEVWRHATGSYIEHGTCHEVIVWVGAVKYDGETCEEKTFWERAVN